MSNRYHSVVITPFIPCCSKIPQRFVMIGLTSAAFFVCFYQRQTYHQALSEIIDEISAEEHFDNSKCPKMLAYYDHGRHISSKNYQPWKPSEVRGITQSFYIGFLIFLTPGGVVADTYGAKSTMAVGITLSTISTSLFPTFTRFGPSVIAFGRALQGMSQGLVFPAASAVTAQWMPASERTIATGLMYAGQFFGWSMGFFVHKIQNMFSMKWRLQFYFCDGLGLIWLILWTVFTFSRPSHCSYIKASELQNIFSSSIAYDRIIGRIPSFIPWKEILCSPPVHALVLINFAGTWVQYTMLNHFKYYLTDVVGVTHELSKDSIEVAHTALGVSTVFWSFASDWLINSDYTGRTTNRKVFGFVSNILMIPCMMGVLLADCHGVVIACLYTAMCFLRAPFYISVRTNVVDLNPHFAGVLNGIVQSTGAIAAIFTWDFFTLIVDDHSDVARWRSLFLVLAAILLFLSLPYLWLGSAEVQPWGITRLRFRSTQHVPSHTSSNVQQRT